MKSKIVIGNKIYNLESSELIEKKITIKKLEKVWSFILDKDVFYNIEGSLYKTKKGSYLLVGIKKIYLVEEEKVKEALKHANYDKYVELFGELEEG